MDLREEIKKIEDDTDDKIISHIGNKKGINLNKKFMDWANNRNVEKNAMEEFYDILQSCLDNASFEGSALENELELCQEAYLNNLIYHKTYVPELKYCNFPLGLMLVIKKFSVISLVDSINAFLKGKNIESITYECTPGDIENIIAEAVKQIIGNDKITYSSYIKNSSFAEDVYMLMKILKPRQLHSDCINNGVNFLVVYLRYILRTEDFIYNRKIINISRKLGIGAIDAKKLCGKYGFSCFSLLKSSKNSFTAGNIAICLSKNKMRAEKKYNEAIKSKKLINKIINRFVS